MAGISAIFPVPGVSNSLSCYYCAYSSPFTFHNKIWINSLKKRRNFVLFSQNGDLQTESIEGGNGNNVRKPIEEGNGNKGREPIAGGNGNNGREESKREKRPVLNLKWRDLLDPNPENVLAVALTGLLTFASVQVLWQLFFISIAILVAALKYSFIAALLLFILITLL